MNDFVEQCRRVIPPPRWTAGLRRGSLVLAAIAALTVITAIGAALVIFASPRAASAPMATIRVAPPRTPLGVAWVEQSGRVVVAPVDGPRVEINKAGSILLIVGIAGLMSSVLYLLWTSKLPSLSAT